MEAVAALAGWSDADINTFLRHWIRKNRLVISSIFPIEMQNRAYRSRNDIFVFVVFEADRKCRGIFYSDLHSGLISMLFVAGVPATE